MSKFRKPFLRIIADVLIFMVIAFTAGYNLEAQEQLLPLRPFKTDVPPVIDGVLDDPVWQKAPYETGFKTFHPDYGIDMVEKTLVYYAHDLENLYFAFRCFDSQPDQIKASINSRDNIRPDDWICLNLDSFNDQQSLYALYCNPMGIQGDSRFEGGVEDFSVDVVWYSSGRIDAKGYVVELKIPFKSIRFSHKEPVEMGVIFERKINRASEAGTYPPLDPDQGPNFLTQTRTLVFYDIKHYTLFELLPAVTYNRRSFADKGKLTSAGGSGDLSLTAKYGLTSRLILDGSYNPDFSQVEADAGQVDFNLRYALFFPEKRPFFLEGLEKFNYGGSDPGDPIRAIVHTRRIVDPLVGLKLNGRVGDKNSLAFIYALDELADSEDEDYAHFSIFRYKRALSKDSFIGGMYTGRDRKMGFNRVMGIDGQLRLTPSSIFGYFAFLSQTKTEKTSPGENGHALGLHYLYNTRDMVLMFGFQDITKDFQTETGYMTRAGVSRLRSGFLWMFYPRSKIIQRIDPMIHSTQIKDKFSNLYETYNSFDLRFVLQRNSSIQVGGSYATEVFLGEKFKTSKLRVSCRSQLTKQFFVSLDFKYGQKIRYIENPYQGKGSDASGTITFLPSEKLHLDLRLSFSNFSRESDSKTEYSYTIIRSKNTYQMNKYLFFRAIVEYNSFRRRLITDFLASFTYIPGTVIHVGYGALYEKIKWDGGEYRDADRFLETERGFFFKASFLWRL
ncbi:DUF5916 domain-containing protein [Acidobacteriota bacterium]